MTSKMFQFVSLLFPLLLMTIMPAAPVYATADLSGTWSGTFNSNHEGVAPFTVTVVINKDSSGRMVGNSTLASHCLKNAHLQVTVTGSTVVLAGRDKAGDNMTVRGSLDTTGTVLNSTYILNGSATGGCETDDGTGSLAKR
jgi:hypothetical protein